MLLSRSEFTSEGSERWAFPKLPLNQVLETGSLGEEFTISEVFKNSGPFEIRCKKERNLVGGRKFSPCKRFLRTSSRWDAGLCRPQRSASPPTPPPASSGAAWGGCPTASSPRWGRRGRLRSVVPEVQNSGGSCLGRRECISSDLRRCPLTRYESRKARLPGGRGTRVPIVPKAGTVPPGAPGRPRGLLKRLGWNWRSIWGGSDRAPFNALRGQTRLYR